MKTTAIVVTAILFGLSSVAVIASPNERKEEKSEHASEYHGKKNHEEGGEYKKGHEASEGEYREGSESEEYSEGEEDGERHSDSDRR